jgi:hypothetical protein
MVVDPGPVSRCADLGRRRRHPPNTQLRTDPAIRLSVSVRSPRAQHFAEWINAVLRLDARGRACRLQPGQRLPARAHARLAVVRRWLRGAAREDRRPGLLASSGSLRHRAYGLEMSPDFHRAYPIADWFLLPASDVHSSHALEVALTKFECQGLELD